MSVISKQKMALASLLMSVLLMPVVKAGDIKPLHHACSDPVGGANVAGNVGGTLAATHAGVNYPGGLVAKPASSLSDLWQVTCPASPPGHNAWLEVSLAARVGSGVQAAGVHVAGSGNFRAETALDTTVGAGPGGYGSPVYVGKDGGTTSSASAQTYYVAVQKTSNSTVARTYRLCLQCYSTAGHASNHVDPSGVPTLLSNQ